MASYSLDCDDDQFQPSQDDLAEFAAWCQERDDEAFADFERFLDEMAEYCCADLDAVVRADRAATMEAA
jgi:hypothetical protein